MIARDGGLAGSGAVRTRTVRTKPTVYLHIGEPKTGTTFLQQVMWANRAQLADHGVLLPGEGVRDHFRANQDLREAPQAKDDPAGSWRGEWDRLARKALTARGTAVISHELLAGATSEQAERAVRSLEPSEVHVVLTVRDFGTLLPAEWQETVKHRNRQSWDDWLADVIHHGQAPAEWHDEWFWRVHDSLNVLGRWSRHVPDERIHVVTVPRQGSPPGLLWERFAGLVGVPPDAVDTARARANASLGLPEVELLRRLNQSLPAEVPNWFYAGRVKERLAHQVLANRPTTGRLQLPARHAPWANEWANRLVRGLEASGYDIVGDVDELRPAPAPAAAPHPADVTAEQLLDAATDSIVALLVREYQRTKQQTASTGRSGKGRYAWVKAVVPAPVKQRLKGLRRSF